MTNPTDAERLAEREAQIRECMSRRIYLAPDQAMLLRFLDGRDATITTLRAERDAAIRSNEYLSNELAKLHGDLVQERDAARAEVARLRDRIGAPHPVAALECPGDGCRGCQYCWGGAPIPAENATPPTTDDVERAREIVDEWIDAHDRGSWLDTELVELRKLICTALATAREQGRAEGAREMRERAAQMVEFEAKHWPPTNDVQHAFVTAARRVRALPESGQ